MLSPEIVKDFSIECSKEFKSQYIDPKDIQAVIDLTKAFEDAGMKMPLDKYFERFCFTLHDRIYLAFDPGIENPNWPIDWQVGTIGHENHHVWQMRTKPQKTNMALDYIIDQNARAVYEAEAYTVTMEILNFLGHPLQEPEYMAEFFIKPNYFVDDNALKLFVHTVKTNYEIIKQGGILFPVSQFAIAFFMRHNLHHAGIH